MSEKKELKQEQLEKVSGGYTPIFRLPGYWYGVYGNQNNFRYEDEQEGYETEVERDSALENAIVYAQNNGVTNITTSKGYSPKK